MLHKKPLGVPFKVVELDFPDKDHAMLWVVRTQLARRNLNALDFKMLLGQQLELEQKVRGGDRHSEEFKKQKLQMYHSDTIDPQGKTAQRVAEEHDTSRATVNRSGALYRAVEVIKEGSPHIGQRIQLAY